MKRERERKERRVAERTASEEMREEKARLDSLHTRYLEVAEKEGKGGR